MYWEDYEDDPRIKRRLFFNLISPWRAHRVLTDKPVWTLFIHGPRVNEKWRYGQKEAPWRGPDTEWVNWSPESLANLKKNGFVLKPLPQYEYIVDGYSITAAKVVQRWEFDPIATMKGDDTISFAGDEYFVRDKNGNLLQTGKVILKS